ncbi:3-oxoacyl-ACP reductase [Pseudarthrobacter sulfonivorans]|uniref:3-oxoacyl-ACP reductase n=1 Tax=Pseudarthrobacter sulfonivorans TaxID=121292 RepID=A0A0U3Q415_9MICC|nr:SDR family NAD(P)-dependent oxidoreductase [Pseudarthrobacter sulfonivorans]ALV39978.1 3-oxoacyl-ACP reductase [Pseudarthrobacter sulfonivorans]
MNTIDLNNKVAIVTGGAQGIGRAIAERLLRSGAEVHIWDVDTAALSTSAQELGLLGKVVAHEVDQTDFAAVATAAKAVEQSHGKIDILVNNAGIAGPAKPLLEYSPQEWGAVIDVDLNGAFNCCHAVVPVMVKNNYGRVLNVASVAGKEGNPNAAAYSAAKAGVIAMTKSLAKELAHHEIAVNCITPTAVATKIFDQVTVEHIGYILERIPRGRFLKAEELAAMVAWLVSAENSFTTGAAFDLSGGRATY